MATIPVHTVTTVYRHEWEIVSNTDGRLTARDLWDGIHFAEKAMENLGIDTSYDDAYTVEGDGNSIYLRVDVEKDD